MNPIYNALVYVVWFFATYYVIVFILLMLMEKEVIRSGRKDLRIAGNPKVSVIVPAFNEEGKIHHTIKSLKEINYKNIEFLIINDGSSDKTNKEVTANIKGDSRFRFIDNKDNKGKAARLNQGIENANGEFIATMDADSIVEKDAFNKVLPYFSDKKVGAVTVSVEVIKAKKFFHKLVELEFILGLSLFLKISAMLNVVNVTPGPFSVYRKKVLDEIGGFDVKNITEDLEIAYRIHKYGYKIDNCVEAKVSTFVPDTFKQLYVQRKRWYSGAIQTLYKHRKMLLKKKHGFFSFVIPYNFLLIFLGLVMFLTSVYMVIKDFVRNITYLQYTNVNFWTRLTNFHFDFLALGNISFIGTSSLILGIVLLLIGLRIAKKNMLQRKLGIIGYPLLFFIYQIFWIGSIIAVIRGKKIKWR